VADDVRKEPPFSPILPSFLLTFLAKACRKKGEYSHGPHVWRRPFLIALVDSATGLCVQGGEPLVGGRGMVAHAKCIRTAVALSAPGPAPLAMGTGYRVFCSAPCRDDERAEMAPHRGRFASPRGSGRRLPGRCETLLFAPKPSSHGFCAVAPLGVLSLAVRADHRSPGGTRLGSAGLHACKTHGRKQSRSLSYLSLTLCCAALHSGWLEGCATPSSQPRERNAPAANGRIDDGKNERPRLEKARSQSRLSSMISIDCSEFMFL
jgi:hypothetical protein